MMRLLRRLCIAGAMVLAITFAAVLAVEHWASVRYAPERLSRVDALIVLGGGVNPDKTQDFIGRQRADTAAAALQSGAAGVAILTGTLGDPIEHPEGEAGLFAARLREIGIAEAQMIFEPMARTTLENLRFSFALGDAAGFERYAIVTDAFHLPRAMALAASLGRDVDGLAAPGLLLMSRFERVGFILRETLAWWCNLYKVTAFWVLGVAGVEDATREAWVY